MKLFFRISLASVCLAVVAVAKPIRVKKEYRPLQAQIVLPVDTPPTKLPYPITDEVDPRNKKKGAIDLNDPSNVKSDVEFDPVTGKYTVYKKIGDQNYRYPMSFTLEEYQKYDAEQSIRDYWRSKVSADKANNADPNKPQVNKPLIGFAVESQSFDRIFGGNTIDIRPQGSAEVTFGVTSSRTDNPALGEKQRRFTNFDFKQRIQLNVLGSVGDKLKITTNYNTEATFDFENQVKLDYTGKEDEIIKKIELGNVSLPLSSSLISGSQTLFGVKTQLQFGRLTSTTVFSSQRGKKSEIDVAGGSQTSNFELKADEYEANKHYFLSQYFRDNYDLALGSLPNVNSGVNITRIEVWVTNTNNSTEETRNLIGISDLGEDKTYWTTLSGEPNPAVTDLMQGNFPDNDQNSIYNSLSNDPGVVGFSGATQRMGDLNYKAAVHYEKLESARKLPETAYTVNTRLGFISLNQQPLNNDEILAVAYEYTLGGKTYQVGQFSTDGITPPNALLLKLLKSTITNPGIPLWDLMMKNVYSINAFQVNKDQFTLNVFYNNPSTGIDINYLPYTNLDKTPLIQVLNMDKLDPNGQSTPDGIFDFVDNAATQGGTIMTSNGRVFLPVVEPFGSHLRKKMTSAGIEPGKMDSVVFSQLYDSTKVAAMQRPELNRFKLKGTYRSASGSEIALNALNVPQGSVSVTAGGVKLVENVDYTVDYNLGRVKILNQGLLESQTPLKVSLESNSLFSVQQKTFIGQRLDYRISKDFNIGATMINLSERPITPKVNFNEEPINNTMIGFDGNYQSDAPFLTRMVDRLPFIETKEPSSVTVSGEYAQLIPGHSKAIGKNGNSYIDDFESSQSTIDLRSVNSWSLASIPQGQPSLFPEANTTNNVSSGFNRAQLSWYLVDNSVFYQNSSVKPSSIDNNILSDHRQRQILEQEVFPNRQLPPGALTNISMFDLAYFPAERGPYNYTLNLNTNGTLADPVSAWAGIQRRLTTTDFEANNIEFVQFWLMDPFNADATEQKDGGSLYINLGNVSEDILKDGRKSFENGLPKDESDDGTQVDKTVWGEVPRKQSIVNAFANVNGSTKIQDVGLDGLSDSKEQAFFNEYLNNIQGVVQGNALNNITTDPSNDNYHYYRGTDYDGQGLDIISRYKRYNGLQGNSPTDKDSPESYSTSGTSIPNTEDVNLDNNLSESESYFQYKIDLKKEEMIVGKNFITSVIEVTPELRNGEIKPVKWYQFKVPVRSPQATINGIQDFRSIRFMRMFMKDFAQPVVLRFARLEFIRSEWRKYNLDLSGGLPVSGRSEFSVGAVNLEENASRQPVNYVLPPDIAREVDYSTANQRQLNEQSLALKVVNLDDGDAKAAFRNVGFDVRSYKKMQMFVHAENADTIGVTPFNYGDVTVFVRLGTDFDNNYYEYEIPVTPTSINSVQSDENLIWPESNNLIIDFEQLTGAKLERNNATNNIMERYEKVVEGGRISIKGNPVLNDVRTIMIGLRNPNRLNNPWADDDAGPKSVEVWVNELRLTDFDEFGGWASVARINAKLADFGNVAFAGNVSTPGFGSIEKKLSERQRETKRGFDASTNLELGKFLPEKSGIKVPFYFGYSESVINPMYDPLNPDIKFDRVAADLTSKEKRDRLKTSQTFNKRRSINFTNVHKERVDANGKMHFYDIENFSFTYSYSENFFRDINTQHRFNKVYRGGITYGFQNKPTNFTPFKNIEALSKSKYLAIIADFNVNLGPKQVGFRTNVDRSYTESQIRNNIPFALDPLPNYTKTFNWQRAYDLKYDVTRSLSVDFSANNNAYIGEPFGRVSKDDKPQYEAFKDTVWGNIKRLGETTNYTHNTSVTYKLPTKKFPLTDWVDVSTSYSSSYQWDRAPFSQDSIGHTIQNSATSNLEFSGNMLTLYNKVPYLKEVLNKKNRAASGGKRNIKTPEVDLSKLGGKDTTKTKKEKEIHFTFGERLASVLMMTKTASVNFKNNKGTLLPGYGRKTSVMGMDNQFEGPGVGFIFGQQSSDYFDRAADKDWLVKESNLFQPATNTVTKGVSYRMSLEPVKSLRVDLNGTKDMTMNSTEFFRYSDTTETFEHQSQVIRGTYTVSIISLGTMFSVDDKKTFSNKVFEDMITNTYVMSKRASDANGGGQFVDSTGYYAGYSRASQDVILPAFLAAYTGKDVNKQRLNPLKQGSLPNWKVTYDGLSKMPFFQKYFRSFTLTHGYRSSYTTSYVTNLQANEGGSRKTTGIYKDYVPENQISAASISEQLSPLIKIDATLKNSLNAQFEIIKDRQVNLSLSNLQITEVKGTEFKIGTGYKFKDVKLPMKVANKEVKSDLSVNVNVSIRKNVTVIRKAAEMFSDPTSGRKIIAIKTSADYNISSRLTIRAFYDRTVTKPVLSIPFPNYVTNAGITLRFILAQ